jgi:hypothetical protein
MFLRKSTGRAGSFLVAFTLAATSLIAASAAIAQDSDAVLKVKPASHDFGKVVIMQASPPIAVTLTNKSRSPINFTSVVAADPFSIENDKCSGKPLAAGRSCKVEVVFHPAVAGKVTDKKGLTVTDSAQPTPQQIELDGQGIVGSFL